MENDNFKTTDLCDESTEKLAVCEPILRPFGKKRRFSGPVSTVKVHEDNVLVRNALEILPPGTVLVVDGGGSKQCALLGDKLAAIAARRGLGGVIINGCVRDTAELAEMEVGILALAAHPRRSGKRGEGEVDVPSRSVGSCGFPAIMCMWTRMESSYRRRICAMLSFERRSTLR